MKKTNIFYWIFTILFAGLMIFSAVPNILQDKASVQLIHEFLGYPVYFVAFVGWAKLVGCLVLLIPGLKILKEWAYAGLFFDLSAVVYSSIVVSDGVVDPRMAWMLAWIVPGVLSYYFWSKIRDKN